MSSDKKLRPMMKVSKMVPYLKNKNIKFNYCSEEEAEAYLRENNNYFNLTAYKHNFERFFENGEFIEKYIDLDFAYLKDLSIIDMELRLILFKMIIDIEHYLKIRILNITESIKDENGYRAVNLFLEKDFNDEKFPKRVHNSIFRKVGSEYHKKIFSKYSIDKNEKLKDIPLWEFLEIITFGELVNFYEFFSTEYDLVNEIKNVYILREIVKLRNAVAHNSCVLAELDKKDNIHTADFKIIKYLRDCGIKSKTRINKLKNCRIRQITYTLYMFNEIVTSESIKKYVTKDVNKLFFNRIIYHKEYYNNNELLKSIYSYFEKIISKYYCEEDQNNSLT